MSTKTCMYHMPTILDCNQLHRLSKKNKLYKDCLAVNYIDLPQPPLSVSCFFFLLKSLRNRLQEYLACLTLISAEALRLYSPVPRTTSFFVCCWSVCLRCIFLYKQSVCVLEHSGHNDSHLFSKFSKNTEWFYCLMLLLVGHTSAPQA